MKTIDLLHRRRHRFLETELPIFGFRRHGALNAEYASAGIHVAHILIDGAVDAPDTLGKMLGEASFQQLREQRGGEHDGLLLPAEMAETYFHIAHQHRSAWTHELDLRAYSDLAWWNHETKVL